VIHVLFVCTANVCRSPLAEGYMNARIRDLNLAGIEAGSAGISALKNHHPFECAVEVARQFGFDISQRTARQLTPEIVGQADHVLCMETRHASAAMQCAPDSLRKIQLLGSYHPDRQSLFQIPDPGAFRVPETLQVFALIRPAVDRFLSSLVENSSPLRG
jgi:protein-tyrosine phosphatase